jgi:hypothetical protein
MVFLAPLRINIIIVDKQYYTAYNIYYTEYNIKQKIILYLISNYYRRKEGDNRGTKAFVPFREEQGSMRCLRRDRRVLSSGSGHYKTYMGMSHDVSVMALFIPFSYGIFPGRRKSGSLYHCSSNHTKGTGELGRMHIFLVAEIGVDIWFLTQEQHYWTPLSWR